MQTVQTQARAQAVAFRPATGRASRRTAAVPTQFAAKAVARPQTLSRRGGRANVAAQAVATGPTERKRIEEEVYVDKAPDSLLRSDGKGSDMRAKFEKMIRKAQDEICGAIERADDAFVLTPDEPSYGPHTAGTKFREDTWTRPGGGGGISRVLAGGNVWEKAGVNVSVVYGEMPPEAYRAATGDASKPTKAGNIPFFAAGISSVMHPWNPYAPTMHFNYRYFETDTAPGTEGAPRAWWFGGGTDITPSYLFEEDMKHFHGIYKKVCDKHDPSYYPKYKQWADDYFLIKHRGERRGLGGIFFDDKNDKDPETILKFSTDCANAVVPAYVPLVEKHKNDPYNTRQKEWQQMRRGRYVEFNLVYDRGTTFGLKTGGRIESILMSLPLTARWEYDMRPKPGTPEADLIDACKNPRNWV